jgi:hypothetical protein
LRTNRYGSSSIDVVSPPLTKGGREGFAQYDVAANASFTGLNTSGAWQTQGSVDINPSTGSGRTDGGIATLNEISTSQTRLSQVFMLGANDRYLSFTLAGSALNDPLSNFPPQAGARANGAAGGSGLSPSDAFEVALLDANTGVSVLGTDGKIRSDAFLNTRREYAGGCPAA